MTATHKIPVCKFCRTRLAFGETHFFCVRCLRWVCRHAGKCPVGVGWAT